VLMVIAWNALFQAILERQGTDYYERDADGKQASADGRPKVKDVRELARLALPERHAIQANLDFFVRLRNLIAHRYLPALDLYVVSEAQAMLLNYESVTTEAFGEQASLGEQLCVPLHLTRFRDK